MTIRPIPWNQNEAREMRVTGEYRGEKLCECCGENIAETTYNNGDLLCRVCVRSLTR